MRRAPQDDTIAPFPMSHPEPATHSARPSHAHPNYILIWVFLAVLTAVELSVAFLPWPKKVIIVLLIGMAFWKAALVGLYYMHLRFEPNRLRILALAPLTHFAVLVLAVITEWIW